MTVKELSRLYCLNQEIELDNKRLEELDSEIAKDVRQLAQLESHAASPSGSNYDGMPKSSSHENKIEKMVGNIVDLQDLIQQKKILRAERAMAIHAKQLLCIAEYNKLDRYISSIPDSLRRLIFTHRFINGLTWAQVAEHIGGKNTEDSVKKLCYRYIVERNKQEG